MRTLRFPRAAAPAPGEVRTVEAGGRRVGLMWVDGELHGAGRRVPPSRRAAVHGGHARAPGRERRPPASTRRASADRLRCPWHKWEFDVRTGVCEEAPRMRVRRYRVWLEDDEIVVSLAPGQGLSRRAQRCERALAHRGVEPAGGEVDGQHADEPAVAAAERDGQPGEALLELVDHLGVTVARDPVELGQQRAAAARIVARGMRRRGAARPRLARRPAGSSAARRSRTKPEAGSVSVRPSHEPTPHHPRSRRLGDHPRAHGAVGHGEHDRLAQLGRERLEQRPGALARAAARGRARARDPRPEPPPAVRRDAPRPRRRAWRAGASPWRAAAPSRARPPRPRRRQDAPRGSRAPGRRARAIRCARRRRGSRSRRSGAGLYDRGRFFSGS